MKPIDWELQANTKIPIEQVLQDLFQIEVPRDAGTWRAHCPLGFEHSDGGRAKSMRVYSDTNSARCFSHGKTFNPVALWQQSSGTWNRKWAAKELLEAYGFPTTPPTLEERWAALYTEKPVDLETADLKSALMFFAQEQLPRYDVLQYEDEVLILVSRILESADKLPKDADYATLEDWVIKSKSILKRYWRKNGWS